MILRGSNTSPIAGQYEVYDIGNNAVLSGEFLRPGGSRWQEFSQGRNAMRLVAPYQGGF